jgi:hypothetical protein
VKVAHTVSELADISARFQSGEDRKQSIGRPFPSTDNAMQRLRWQLAARRRAEHFFASDERSLGHGKLKANQVTDCERSGSV